MLLALGFFAPGEAAARIHLDARPNHSAEEKLAPRFFDSELALSRLAAALQAAELQQAKSTDGYDLTPGCSLAAERTALDVSKYGRVKPTKGTRAEVWERSKSADGKVYDPSGREIKPGEPWELGHKPGNKFSDAQRRAAEQNWDADTWRRYQRDPDIYRPERPRTNASHQYESDW